MSEFLRAFCKTYGIAAVLLENMEKSYTDVFRRILLSPPTDSAAMRNAKRESLRTRGLPQKTLFICYTNRSGSSFLSDLLTLSGQCGRPQEYFTAKNVERIARRFQVACTEDYLQQLVTGRQSSNGIFSSKCAFFDIIYLHYRGYLHQYFPNPRYVFLEREDKIMQAISWYRAAAQKTWSSAHHKRRDAPYNHEQIAHYHDLIAHSTRQWEHFFATEQIQPLRLTYEQLMADPTNQLSAIAHHLELDTPLRVNADKTRFKIQRDNTSQQWAKRYLAENSIPPAKGT